MRIELTDEEANILSDYLFSKVCVMQKAGFENSKTCVTLDSIKTKLRNKGDLIVGDLLVTQIIVCNVPIFHIFKIVKVCQDYYKTVSLVDSVYYRVDVSKGTLTEVNSIIRKRKFVPIDRSCISNEVIEMLKKQNEICSAIGRLNERIRNINNKINQAKIILQDIDYLHEVNNG